IFQFTLLLTFILGQKIFSQYSIISGYLYSLQYLFLFFLYTYLNLNSYQFTVYSETPFFPFCELYKTLSILIIFTAEFSLYRCFTTASHTLFGKACYIAIFKYSLIAKVISSLNNKN